MTEPIDDLLVRIDSAEQRIRPYILTTPLDPLHALSDETGAEVLLKAEHLQHTGSFKARGATSKILTLTDDERARGVVTASSGNHGLGVAFALAAAGGRGTVYVPHGASPVKVAAIERYGAKVEYLGDDGGDTEVGARAIADAGGLAYVSPYNDLDVIAGQGTIGVELGQQSSSRPLDAVVVAVGGGGLVAGIGAAVRRAFPDVRVIGASPANDAAMYAAVQVGEATDYERAPTLSDGTSGGLEPGAVTVGLCQQLVDEWVLVSEDEIRASLRLVIDTHHQLIEGAAAVAVAACRQFGSRIAGQRVAVVSCGANISSTTLAAALG